MKTFKKMLRFAAFCAFLLLAAVGIGIGGAVPIPQIRKEDRIEVISERLDEDEDEEEQKELK